MVKFIENLPIELPRSNFARCPAQSASPIKVCAYSAHADCIKFANIYNIFQDWFRNMAKLERGARFYY